MADAPAPTPTMSDLFADYNPQGADGGLFAPAYVRGLPQSEAAVTAWQAQNRPLTAANIEQTRMPTEYTGASPMSAGDGVYGKPLPLNQSYLDPRGQIDPEALRVLAQGGRYDLNARRDAIAARVASNAAARAAVPLAAPAIAKPPSILDFTPYNEGGG